MDGVSCHEPQSRDGYCALVTSRLAFRLSCCGVKKSRHWVDALTAARAGEESQRDPDKVA